MSIRQDNRRSFRITETVCLIYERISEDVFRRGLAHWKLLRGNGAGIQSILIDVETRLSEKLFILNAKSRILSECLELLNEKINIVLDELPEFREPKAALARQPQQTCEISADGMVFTTDEEIPVNTTLALRFLLLADNRYVETFCRVVRTVNPPDNDVCEGRFGIAVEFHGLKTAQRDILIRHLFDRESESLRIRRLETETTD